MCDAPFSGLKVFDLSTFWSGAYLTMYLGAFGRRRREGRVDSARRTGTGIAGSLLRSSDDWYEIGPMWQATNLNKRDITLDLTLRGRP